MNNKTNNKSKQEVNKPIQVDRNTADFNKKSLIVEEIKTCLSNEEDSDDSDTLLKDISVSRLFETKISKKMST